VVEEEMKKHVSTSASKEEDGDDVYDYFIYNMDDGI
jgi:hypothetical protein